MIYFIRECLFMLNIGLMREQEVSPYLLTIVLVCLPFYVILYGGVVAIIIIEDPLPILFGLIKSLTALSFFLTLVIFIMEKKSINFFKVLNTQIENRRYEISMTQKLDVSLIISRLKSLLDEEKIFCDEDLSLSSLARELAIEPYQLSRIVNENFNKNFKNFINEYRIEEAKKLLLAEKDRTITSVAYAVGFNSTTVFYEWFNRITGIAPKKFRNINSELAGVAAGAAVDD
jgi:AraC-like DNA-binding protein